MLEVNNIESMILCATYPRSGSHLFRTAFYQMTEYPVVPTHKTEQEKDHLYVVSITRNPKDSIISRIAMQMHFDDSKPIEYYADKSLNEYISYYEYLYNVSDVVITYEDLMENTKDVIKAVSSLVNIKVVNQDFIDDVISIPEKNHLKSSKESDKYQYVLNALANYDFSIAENVYNKLKSKAIKFNKITIKDTKVRFHHPDNIDHINEDMSFVSAIPDTDPMILEWSNVELKFSFEPEEERNVFVIEEPCVLLFPTDRYYHLMVDDLAHYLYIKKFIPEVKPVFLQFVNTTEPEHRSDIPYSYILELLGLSYKDVLPYNPKENNTILIKKMYKHTTEGDDPFSMWKHDNLFRTLRETFFIPGLPSEKNIYISRKKAKDRAIDGEEKLEKFFSDKGFEIVYLEEMQLDEQFELFGRAKNIVARTGSSMTNLCFVNKDATIIDFNSNESYYPSEWKRIGKVFGLNYISVYVGHTESVDTIIQRIESLSILDKGVS